jgi:hypothetical protein
VPNPSETFARWYLRFNGYLGVENLIVHEPVAGAIPQGTEFDVVAVRFPHSREIADFELPRHNKLTAVEKAGVVNVVVAEVKGGRDTTVNDVWRPETDGGRQLDRLKYLIRWLGFHDSEADIEHVAAELRRTAKSDRGCFIQAVYFGARCSPVATSLGISQILLAEIASWIVDTRASCWRDRDIAKRSCHDQWDPFIKNVWNLADPDVPGTPEAKTSAILALTLGRPLP